MSTFDHTQECLHHDTFNRPVQVDVHSQPCLARKIILLLLLVQEERDNNELYMDKVNVCTNGTM